MNNEHKRIFKYNIQGFEHLPKPPPYSLLHDGDLYASESVLVFIQQGPCHPLRELSRRGVIGSAAAEELTRTG